MYTDTPRSQHTAQTASGNFSQEAWPSGTQQYETKPYTTRQMGILTISYQGHKRVISKCGTLVSSSQLHGCQTG